VTWPDAPLWLCALNLGLIALLPRLFFRRGRLNLAWWLTAAPFGVAGAALFAHVVRQGAALHPAAGLGATVLAAGSILLIGVTLGSHAEPVSLWHQPDDAPRGLVTHGAYARIRHPFYAAFLLALGACALAAPGALTGVALAWAVVQLRRTALREERRLLASAAGTAYGEYMQRTGRFVPRLRAAARPHHGAVGSLPERT
jgi:protein-S-isoprenylcysteine O-methyltransferase Ste14